MKIGNLFSKQSFFIVQQLVYKAYIWLDRRPTVLQPIPSILKRPSFSFHQISEHHSRATTSSKVAMDENAAFCFGRSDLTKKNTIQLCKSTIHPQLLNYPILSLVNFMVGHTNKMGRGGSTECAAKISEEYKK